MLIELFEQSPTPWTPHAYQKRGVKWLLEHAGCALFLDPGLGKTAITLAAIKILKQKGVVSKVLVIAPKRVCYEVWPREAQKWRDFAGLRVSVLHGPKKESALKTDADIYVINPEGLDWLLQADKSKSSAGRTRVAVDLKRWRALGFDTLIVDELTKFKHTNTNRFKALRHVLGTFARRWGLTGSPAPNGLMDLFGQCYVIDQGRSLGPYITHYRMKYFVQSYDGFSWDLREGADQEIYERIAPIALRMSAADYLELPELVENTIRVDLPPDSRKIYDAVEDDLIAQIDKRTIVAANAAAASSKCRQIANGAVYVDSDIEALFKGGSYKGREWVGVHDAKLDALEDLIDELQGSPLLVAYDFRHDLERLQARFGRDVPYIGSGVAPKRTTEIIDSWNAGKLPVLLGHPQSIGHGLNLQESGHHICWFSPTWNYELYDQFNRRVYRQGVKASRVFVHRIAARGTVDELVLAALATKGRDQNALLDALKDLARHRGRN